MAKTKGNKFEKKHGASNLYLYLYLYLLLYLLLLLLLFSQESKIRFLFLFWAFQLKYATVCKGFLPWKLCPLDGRMVFTRDRQHLHLKIHSFWSSLG